MAPAKAGAGRMEKMIEIEKVNELVEALRCCAGANTKPTKCPHYGDSCGCGGKCLDKHLTAAADAIEALNRLLDQNTQRCEALRGQLREAHESYERHLHELEAQLPKRGKWLIHSTGGSMATKKCPFCGSESWQGKEYAKVPKYCENCGAHLPTFDIVDWVDYLYAKMEGQE